MKLISLIRKFVIALVGCGVLVVGIILIPLPGPGLLLCLLGLMILSIEFDWARRHADRAKDEFRKLLKGKQSKRD